MLDGLTDVISGSGCLKTLGRIKTRVKLEIGWEIVVVTLKCNFSLKFIFFNPRNFLFYFKVLVVEFR